LENIIDKSIKEVGLSYKSFMEVFTNQVENPNFDNPEELKHYENRKLNLHRTQKWMKTFYPSQELVDAVSSISTPQTWMVITETWCGDSAQNTPIIIKAASLSNKTNLRFVFRDENLDIMDCYLTNGSRSIPKLVVFDENDNELFQWGPRPVEAQNLMMRRKSEGIEKSEIIKELHLWYAKNRGIDVENELIELIKSLNN
jgi:hypothetical protein